jgi:PTH1 family peptidyl-tRNA hydrolase
MNFLIAGLGNIGSEYELTRHNIGFLTLDRLADQKNVAFKIDKLAFKTEFSFKGKTFHLIEPTTYMNLSGKAVLYWMRQLNIPQERILVICDDLNLPFEKLRLKPKGSSGGQNGLKNISEMLNSEQYARLRMGIGNDYQKGRQVEYVLGKFNQAQFEALPSFMDRAGECVISFALEGIDVAMNKFNNK